MLIINTITILLNVFLMLASKELSRDIFMSALTDVLKNRIRQ